MLIDNIDWFSDPLMYPYGTEAGDTLVDSLGPVLLNFPEQNMILVWNKIVKKLYVSELINFYLSIYKG